MSAPSFSSFADELCKIAAPTRKFTLHRSRKGRRPMRVDTMLRKEKEGSLYKFTKQGGLLQRMADFVAKGNEKLPEPLKGPAVTAYSRLVDRPLVALSQGHKKAKKMLGLSGASKAGKITEKEYSTSELPADIRAALEKTKHGSEQARLFYSEVDPKIGSPAKSKRKKGDVPSRDDIPGRVTAEERQNITQSTIHPTEHHRAPEGFGGY